MGNLQARVVRGQLQVRDARHGDDELESNLTRPQVGQRGRIVERGQQAIPVTDSKDLDRRGQRRPLVDDDLAGRA